ncbi:MAG: hypothetical protein J6N95_04025 [Bacilli bacterium]|nr:hypothetical protein [Bacilli bacterium]
MKKGKLLVSLAALSLLLVGCNKPADKSDASKAAGTSQPASAQPSSNKPSSSATPSSKAPAVPTPDATQALVTQETTPTEGGAGETITWNAQDANKEASDGFDSNGKFKATGDYVQYTFNATMKMTARLYVEMPPRNDNVWDRETETGHQTIWYNWQDGDDWKYNVQVNTIDVDQSKMGTYKVNEQDIEIKYLVYTDFLADGASTLFAPWFEFEVLQGRNTIRIERNLGYSVSMKSFKVLGLRVAN